MLEYLKSLIQLILAPRYGWEDIEADDIRPEQIFLHGFLPLSVLSGLCVFVQLAYHPVLSLVGLTIMAVSEFVSYFLSYYIALLILGSVIPGISFGEFSRDRLKTYVLSCLGLMCLMGILKNCLPSDFATVYFLLIYVAVIMWRGIDFMRVELRHEIKFTLVSVIAIMLPTLLINLIFGAAGA